MNKIQNNTEIYYVYDLVKDVATLIGNKEDLLAYLLKHFLRRPFLSNKFEMDYSRINFSGNDTYYFYDIFDTKSTRAYYIRPYLFYDGDGRIVDVRMFKKDIEKRVKEKNDDVKKREQVSKEYGYYYLYERTTRKDNHSYGDVIYSRGYWRYCAYSYRFRMEPVPHIRKRRGGPYQTKHYGRIIRMVNHPDFQEYGRKSHYQSLIDNVAWYEYGCRHNDKSWKNNKKIKKQWQKNLH